MAAPILGMMAGAAPAQAIAAGDGVPDMQHPDPIDVTTAEVLDDSWPPAEEPQR